MSFQLARTAPAQAMPRRWLRWRWPEQRYTVASFLALGLFLLMVLAVPPETMTVSNDLTALARAVVPVVVTAPEPPSPDVPSQVSSGTGQAGKTHAGPNGQAGRRDSKRPRGALKIAGDGIDMRLGKARAIAAIRDRGIIGLLNADDDRFRSILGSESAVGSGLATLEGNVTGPLFADAYGFGGLGSRGTGSGGGGSGLGTIGPSDHFGTVGGSYGRGPGLGELARKQIHKPPSVGSGIVTTRGSLDKEIIRRVVRLHMNEVKYCYDKELTRNAALEGRISVQFVIAGTGQVLSSVLSSTTMNNVAVEACLLDAVKRWDFPKPTGGGIAIVSYPFNFVAGR